MLRLRRRIVVALAALAILLISAAGPNPVQVPYRLTAVSGSWTEYHHDDAHTGFDSSLATLTGATVGWTSSALDDSIYASPLIFNGVVYAATLNNTVYALDQSTGAILWSKNVGAPQTGGWTCGNISPTGILGTPIIDTAANRIYVVAEIAGSTPTYHLFGLDLAASGNIVLNTAIAPAGFNWQTQQERGALALHGGYVYVPFGGRAGDCTPYNGWVVGVPTSGSTSLITYKTVDGGSGLWSAGGLAIDDSTGDVFGSTGNTSPTGSCTSMGQNDSVVRLSPALALLDFFAPQDWQADWCGNDQDLGSAGPLLISSSLMFQAGKWGGGFLLNPYGLGGVDGQLFPTPKPQTYAQADVCFGNHSDATFGGFAYAAPFVYVECEGQGIVALNVSGNTFSQCNSTCAAPDWHAGSGSTFGAPIVAGGAVWAATSGGGLYAFNAATGAQIFHSPGFGINRFVTPAEAGGQVFVPANDNTIRSFDMTFLPWTSLHGVLISSPDAASWGSGRADTFAVGQDQGLWQDTWNGTSWLGWTPLGGIITSDPGAVSWGVNRIDVVGRGSDGAMYHRSFNGSSWSAWDRIAGGLSYGPDLSSWGSGRLDLFITGLDHALWHTYWTGTGWAGWERLGGYLTSSPTAVSWGANRIDIFARGGDNQMWHLSWSNGWSGWEPVGGLFSSGPDAASCASNHLDVFALGIDGGLWRQSWTGNGWTGWAPVGSQWTSDPSAVCLPGTTTVDLFERGSDGAIWTAGVPGT